MAQVCPLNTSKLFIFFSFHHWVSDYKHGVDQASALKDMLEDQAHDPEMLWNYIEKRYNLGTGAFSHVEL